jgi:DNA-binding FadR family transcriptional regulator
MMKKSPFSPVRNERVSCIVEGQIKEAIFQKRYRVGEKLPSEKHLADLFGVSRMSVREALRSLERSGFLTIKKGAQGGAYIQEKSSEPVLESMRDMLQAGEVSPEEFLHARLLIEPSVAAEAAKKAGPEDVKHLRDIIEKMTEQLENRQPDFEKGSGLHSEIAKITGNRVIVMMMEVLTDIHIDKIRNLNLDDRSIKDIHRHHTKIIDAIEKKDPQSAFESMKAHILANHSIYVKGKNKFFD